MVCREVVGCAVRTDCRCNDRHRSLFVPVWKRGPVACVAQDGAGAAPYLRAPVMQGSFLRFGPRKKGLFPVTGKGPFFVQVSPFRCSLPLVRQKSPSAARRWSATHHLISGRSPSANGQGGGTNPGAFANLGCRGCSPCPPEAGFLSLFFGEVQKPVDRLLLLFKDRHLLKIGGDIGQAPYAGGDGGQLRRA